MMQMMQQKFFKGQTMEVVGALNDENYNIYLLHMGDFCQIVEELEYDKYLVQFENGKKYVLRGKCLSPSSFPFIDKSTIIVANNIGVFNNVKYDADKKAFCFELKHLVDIVYSTKDIQKLRSVGYTNFSTVINEKIFEICRQHGLENATMEEAAELFSYFMKKDYDRAIEKYGELHGTR